LKDVRWYAFERLAMFGPDLEAVSWFYLFPSGRTTEEELPPHWQALLPEVKSELSPSVQNLLRQATAYSLQRLGMLKMAGHPLSATLSSKADSPEQLRLHANGFAQESERQLLLGDFKSALKNSREALKLADESNDQRQRISKRCRLANIHHLMGNWEKAHNRFEEAKKIAKDDNTQPELTGTAGILLAEFELTLAEMCLINSEAAKIELGDNFLFSREKALALLNEVSHGCHRMINAGEEGKKPQLTLQENVMFELLKIAADGLIRIYDANEDNDGLEDLDVELGRLQTQRFDAHFRTELPKLLLYRIKFIRHCLQRKAMEKGLWEVMMRNALDYAEDVGLLAGEGGAHLYQTDADLEMSYLQQHRMQSRFLTEAERTEAWQIGKETLGRVEKAIKNGYQRRRMEWTLLHKAYGEAPPKS
jgi:tetratricopeptide (TPR) repeat protein